MEMEGRVYSDLYRNSSEDMFIRTLMESPVGMPSPTMEILGFKNLSSNFRADSEELFKNWLTNGENQGHNPSSLVHNRSRQLSRRLLVDQATQQNGVSFERKPSNENLMPQSSFVVGESSNDVNALPIRNVGASNLYLAKAWFHSSQPMTRSRSSELRRRYVAMQNSQTAIGMEAMNNASGNQVNQLKQQFVNQTQINEASMYNTNNFIPQSHSSSSNINELQFNPTDKVSSVVSMLKGTLERKKLRNQTEKEAIEDDSLGYYNSTMNNNNNINEIQDYEVQGTFQDLSTNEMKDPGLFQIDADMDNFVAPTNHIQMSFASREASQSESSPVISNGFDACDGQSNSGQTPSACESSRKQAGIAKNLGTREHMYDNLQEDHKQKRSLIRFGSVTSAASVDMSRDPTKKRRVERSRKMAEAKGRTQTPVNSTDMQSILKRCENLEKEVRSLKLNLAFMNRKDSEQTKQIEELQKQHEEMKDEKERLLEEIERILSQPDKM